MEQDLRGAPSFGRIAFFNEAVKKKMCKRQAVFVKDSFIAFFAVSKNRSGLYSSDLLTW